jgi:hypothetical protein
MLVNITWGKVHWFSRLQSIQDTLKSATFASGSLWYDLRK